MTDDKIPYKTPDLCRLAKERPNPPSPEPQPTTEPETQRLLHELRVHQVELEMQNEELSQARNEVEELLEKYTDLYDFAPVGYFTLDGHGVIRSANLRGATLFGADRATLPGRRFGSFLADEARLLFAEFLGQVLAHEGTRYCEVPLKIGGGGGSPRFARIEAMASQSSSTCRVAVVDITEQKLYAERIIRLNDELERRVKERTHELEFSHRALTASHQELEISYKELETFAYAVAHDLRTPLRSMSGFSNILLDNYSSALDESGKELLGRIAAAAGRMGQLVDGILDLSRLTRTKLIRQNVDLSSLVLEVVELLRELEPERKVEIDVAEGVNVYGDPLLLRQLLENLLQNAWKYTVKCPAPRIEFGTKGIGQETVYFVKDNGIGFDMLHTSKLFAPFERLHRPYEYEGIGIGLASVQRIVVKHDGRIWAEGKPDEGATFSFTLKARDCTPGLVLHPEKEPSQWEPTKTNHRPPRPQNCAAWQKSG